jgi:hypothetical protein
MQVCPAYNRGGVGDRHGGLNMKTLVLNVSGNALASMMVLAVLAAGAVSICGSPGRAQDGGVRETDLPQNYARRRERQLQRLSVPSSAVGLEKPSLVYPHQGLRKISPSDSQLGKLRKERYNETLIVLDGYLERRQIDPTSIPASFLPLGAKRVEEAELALSEKPQDQIRARTNYLGFAKQYEKLMRELVTSGSFVAPYEYDEARLMRLDAEIKLLEAERSTGSSQAN